MKKYITLLIAILCFLMISPTLTAMQNPSTIDQLLQNIHYITSYKADFTQTIVDRGNDNKTVSYGTLWVKQPNFFKWEISKPNKQVLISNGTKLWNYDIDLEQVTIQDVPKEITDAPILLLLKGDPHTLERLFRIAETKNNVFSLIPKEKDSVPIKQILLYFDNDNLRKITLRSNAGIDTYILFDKYKAEKINDNFFDFKIPEGVDVLGNTSD